MLHSPFQYEIGPYAGKPLVKNKTSQMMNSATTARRTRTPTTVLRISEIRFMGVLVKTRDKDPERVEFQGEDEKPERHQNHVCVVFRIGLPHHSLGPS
jgi:hypothetical protein